MRDTETSPSSRDQEAERQAVIDAFQANIDSIRETLREYHPTQVLFLGKESSASASLNPFHSTPSVTPTEGQPLLDNPVSSSEKRPIFPPGDDKENKQPGCLSPFLKLFSSSTPHESPQIKHPPKRVKSSSSHSTQLQR